MEAKTLVFSLELYSAITSQAFEGCSRNLSLSPEKLYGEEVPFIVIVLLVHRPLSLNLSQLDLSL